jgi:hypothetical protein
MTQDHLAANPSRGQITSGVTGNTIIERTLEFVERELPLWRDHAERKAEQSEERLNAQLCKHLEIVSRQSFPMVYFQHEEKQVGRRQVDIAALPIRQTLVGATLYSRFEAFLLFECKRLPAPTTDREREYVTGGDAQSGGIQRFKLGFYGSTHRIAGLVGYVQDDHLREWLVRINQWICELALNRPSTEQWNESEQLGDFHEEATQATSRSSSTHPRLGGITESITIRHLRIEMKDRN